MWTIIATLIITGIVTALTYFLVGPYRRPADHVAASQEDHGHGGHH